ncbi:MAG: hypothetical protein ACW98Y_06035 [Candidatus Thorarchaeota archaeon]
MEPIGTITQYFPFLDKESKETLQIEMDAAYNYHDFVKGLNQRVLEEDCSDLAIYFALHHSALVLDMDSIEKIGRKYGKLPILRPNLFYASVYQGNVDDVEKVHESADAILKSNPPDWLVLEMRLLKFEVDMIQYPKTLYNSENFEEIEKLLEKSPELEFYENVLFDCLSEKAMRDGDAEEVIRCIDLAIKSTEKSNDIVRLAYHLRRKSDYLQTSDIVEAKRTLIRARDIMRTLGNMAGEASILYYLSRLDALRGEYNLAIARCLEVIQIRESMDLSKGVYAIMLSTLYNAIGEPEAGLEWAKMAEVDFERHPAVKPRSILNQAWALILLGKNTVATLLIDSIRGDILKSGLETILAWLYFVSGVLDFAKGQYYEASANIEDALNLYEGKGYVENAVIFMYYLAQLDAYRVMASQDDSDEHVTPWISLLEDKARGDDLPGILGQVLIVKIKIALSQNDDDSVRELVNEIKLLGQEPSLDFLNTTLEVILKRG